MVTRAASDRALELCVPAARRAAQVAPSGYLDVLGTEDAIGSHPGQQLMASRALPLIYERLWRPVLGRAAMGLFGPGMRDEHSMAEQMLHLLGGERVLDVGCGTGAFTQMLVDRCAPAEVQGIDPTPAQLAFARPSSGSDCANGSA